MKKVKVLELIVSFLLVIFLISEVSAGIYVSQMDSVYNLGEMIQMMVEVTPVDAGPMRINLVCEGVSIEVYKGVPTQIIQLPLTSLWMNGITGECYFSVNYNNEIKESTRFKISKQLEINLDTDSFFARPGETITISGNAERMNDEGAEGDVEIEIPLLANKNESRNESLYGKVVDGKFYVNYTLPENTPARDYRIDVIVYEESYGERTSEGIVMANLQVFQVLRDIDIALDMQNIDPGETINFRVILIDQAEDPVDGEVTLLIKNEKSDTFFQNIVKSSETIEYKTLTNMTAGYYEIEASIEGLSSSKKFYVNEKALVSFELINGTLIIKNIGNIPYNKDIKIEINGESFIRNVNIRPGEKKELKLTGSEAGNSVKVSDGDMEMVQENVKLPVVSGLGLTGAAVGVGDSSISDLINTPIIWIVFLIILGAIVLFLFRDILKKKSFAYPAKTNKEYFSQVVKLDNKGKEIKNENLERVKSAGIVRNEMEKIGIGDRSLAPIKKSYIDKKPEIKDTSENKVSLIIPKVQKNEGKHNQAEQVLVTDGQRSRVAIIALKIKNDITKFSKQSLEKAIEHVYNKKAAVYEHGDYILIIFSPIITKSFRNEIEAAKDAEQIVDGLREHNKRFSDKIEFGIAINSGETINKMEGGKLKFTPLGTLTISVRKLADISNGEILMTREAYEKAMSEVKADKKIINGAEVYQVKKVADYEKNKKFIENFLKREGDNKNKSMIPSHRIDPKSFRGDYNPNDSSQ